MKFVELNLQDVNGPLTSITKRPTV